MSNNYPPTSFEIVVTVKDDEELGDVLADAISDEYGFCHYGFEYELLKENNDTKLVKVSNVDWDLEE